MHSSHGNDRALIRIGDAASRLGVSINTLRRWEAEQRLAPATRTLGGHRLYRATDIDALVSRAIERPARAATAS